MKIVAVIIAAKLALASSIMPAKEAQIVYSGDLSAANVVADVTVPLVLPVPGTSLLAIGNVTLATFTNGTLVIKKLLTFPGLTSYAAGGLDISIRNALALKQEDSVYSVDPLDPEAEIDIEEEDIDVRINGVNGNTAIDIFF